MHSLALQRIPMNGKVMAASKVLLAGLCPGSANLGWAMHGFIGDKKEREERR